MCLRAEAGETYRGEFAPPEDPGKPDIDGDATFVTTSIQVKRSNSSFLFCCDMQLGAYQVVESLVVDRQDC